MGQRVTDAAERVPPPEDEALKRFYAAAGSWKGHHDDPDELIRMLYEARITGSRESPDP